MPEELTEWTVWLYDEIHLAPHNAFELRALFDTGEFRVVAEEIRVDDKLLKRYVVPEEPPAPPPTLFLDRQQRHSGKRKR
ncbi:MAG: hypothetical protein KF861_05060 [Planctomycetaceae bacterium]|nr:hypothetical protein [Planctomycetaceae bacterium]